MRRYISLATFGALVLGCSGPSVQSPDAAAGMDAAADGEDAAALDGNAADVDLDATVASDSASPRDSGSDATTSAEGGCCGETDNCSINADCCSGACLWTGRGAQCARSCTTNGQCPSGCCTDGACAPAAEWCQSTFACWPLGHGCASDPTACCAGTVCADVALEAIAQILVCTVPCATGADCTSGCCTTFQSGDQLCDRSIVCGSTTTSCRVVTIPPQDAGKDAGAAPEAGCAIPCNGQCVGARCMETLATNTIPMNGLVLDATHVYFTIGDSTVNDGAVMRVNLDGGPPTTLSSSEPYPLGVAVDSTNVYWADNSIGEVKTVPLDGGGVSFVSIQPEFSWGVAVNATTLYWLGQNIGVSAGDVVMSAPLDGGAAASLYTDSRGAGRESAGPFGIALDSSNVYWADAVNGAVMQMPLDGGTPTVVASQQTNVSAVAADATGIYWVLPSAIMKAPLDGGPAMAMTPDASTPGLLDLALDGQNLYYTVASVNSAIMKLPLDGGAPEVLAVPSGFPNAIAVDGTSVYWTETGFTVNGNRLMKLTPK